MTVNFENYAFEIQKTSDGPKLVCITSKKIIEGVIISRKANWYETEVLQHTFFPRELYETSEIKNPQNAYLTDVIKTQMAYIGSKYESEEELRERVLMAHKSYQYGILKNIISDIVGCIGGYEFLQSMVRYLENDKVSVFIDRVINELET